MQPRLFADINGSGHTVTDYPPTHQECLLELKGMCKDFPGVRALHDVNLNVRAGTVHALIGENGAGKSTLMKILMGLIPDFQGSILLKKQTLRHRGVREALGMGLAMIHQELTYVPHLSIAQNIFLGKEPTRLAGVWIDRGAMIKQTQDLLNRVGLALDPNALMKDLGVAQQQMVEIAKALSYGAEVIIMDEPTSALSERETRRLFELIHEVKASHCAVIYITHRLDEVFELADEVTVLRDGCSQGTHPMDDMSVDRLITLMVGRELAAVFPAPCARPKGTEVLSVHRLCRAGAFQDISFAVHRGEILGLAGLMGAGRTEVMRSLFGLDPLDSGQVFVNRKPVGVHHPRDAIQHGLALVSEDRQITGLVPCLGLRQNMTLSHLALCSKAMWIDPARERGLVQGMMARLAIKAQDPAQRVHTLSGGNQQKVVLGKALLGDPDILILDEPTRGIDVGARVEIYRLIRALADQGMAILMVSSDLTEILGMSDRILVLREGRITGSLDRNEATPETIMHYALSGDPHE
ncbi:MAG: sugar ABC transporter ATP-binding protein [Phycisphaerae bacterium]|nr:sugar ABC transporter ATP-binding protein [Phycisphaerae bacterium]